MKAPPKDLFFRAQLYENEVARFRKWSSRCGGWAISLADSKLGLGQRYLVIKRGLLPDGSGRHWEMVVSRHRRLDAAVRLWRKAAGLGRQRGR